jgi:streptogramin lyase
MRRLLCGVLVSVCAVVGVSASSASAHWGSPASFGGGDVFAPLGVAVDGSGDVYVGSLVVGGVDEFDASHGLVAPPSPFGAGKPSPFGSAAYSGVAVDPVDGDVYVVDAYGQEVDTYDPSSGALLSSFPIPGAANYLGSFTLVQIASDAVGNVYVPNAPNNEVQVFSPSGGAPGGVAASITGSGADALKGPTGVAVSASGDVWVADSGNGRIEEFEPSGAFVKEIVSPGVLAVAVDAAGDVFASVHASTGAHVLEYNAAGVQIDDFGLGTLGEVEGEGEIPNVIAFDEQHEVLYVADFENSVVWAFVPAPEVTTGPPSNLRQASATVSGHVDPAGGGEIVSCEFEYGTSTAYGQTAPCEPPAPYTTATSVSANLTGLVSGTGYHYRLVAGNARGSSDGGDETLTAAGPVVGDESAEARTRSATLTAQIDPNGQDTTCAVQYVSESEFQSTGYTGATTVPCTPSDVGSGSAERYVSATLPSLELDASYHYRFIASNQAGTEDGADQVFATFGIQSFALGTSYQDGQPYTQAGGHPYELTAGFSFNTSTDRTGKPGSADANPEEIRTELPAGMIGNPDATPKCAPYDVAHADCSGATQVGLIVLHTAGGGSSEAPIYNVVPPAGLAAQFAARFNGFVTAHIDVKLRSGGDYGVTADALDVSAGEGLDGISVTLWGVPAESSHDKDRYCPAPGEINEEYPCSSGAPVVPFLTNATSCTGALTSTLRVASWQEPGLFLDATSEMPGVTGCDRPPFTPTITVQPEARGTSEATGMDVDLHVPQNENPAGVAEAELKDAVVTLPEGVAVNPSSANGLAACAPGQIELHGPEPAGCPDASKIGTVEIDSPLVDHPLDGGIYLATPYENPFGSLIAVYIAVHDPVTGVVVKLAGHVEADPGTGRLTTRFDENPQLPFEDLRVHFFGGANASLVTPDSCGTFTTNTDLTPWTSPEGADAFPTGSFQIEEGCAPRGFAPGFTAGMSSNQAGAFSPFSVTLSRSDGDQQLAGVSVTTPPGLLGLLKSVQLCGEPQAAQGTCGAGSLIGHTSVAAGVGPDPVWVQGGQVYLTGPYKGAPFGLSVVVPAVAGPFNLGTVVIRAAISVDPHTAQITVSSDPFPTILDGIPLKVRTVSITIDRAGFMFNPTSCEPLSVGGTVVSTQGAQAGVSSRFQAAGCQGLPFKPVFSVSTQAKTSKKNGASLTVKGLFPTGEANVHSVAVILPKQLPARLTTIQQACTEATFAANPASCPAGSDIGTATASTPILANPVTGPVYLVSHGGAAFPDVVAILQGEGVTVDLVGSIDIKKGITSSDFATVPDAPIGSFALTLPEGPHSGLAAVVPAKAKGNMCGQTLTMPFTSTGQNGVVVKQTAKIAVVGCPKPKKKAKARSRARGAHGKQAKK